MDLTERLDIAYGKLGLMEPFIAAVMARVKRTVADVANGIPVTTAATDGTTCYYNADFCKSLTDNQLFGLVLHESCHVVLMHMWRREGRNPAIWNVANDAIINHYIRHRSYKPELPPGGVHIDWVTEQHSSEEVYDRLRQEMQEGGSGKGKGKGQQGSGDMPAGGFDGQGDLIDAVDESTRADMEATIVAAAQMAKSCGHGSALIDRILETTGKSAVHWQDVTRAMLTSVSAGDYTYRRPSRRFIGTGMYLPSLRSESLGGLLIGFDTSGSMGPRECNQIAAEIQAICDDLMPEFVEVVYCDYDVTHVERFDRDELLQLHPKGGGGTRFKPVFDYAEKSGQTYCGMIFFTDMEGNLNECKEPPYPVVWADIGHSHPPVPFGTRADVVLQ